MAVITVRNLPDPTKEALRVKAAKAGISLEQYVRNILQDASKDDDQSSSNIMEIAATYFAKPEHSDIELNLPLRSSSREDVKFD
jgi:plasmid stability protein